MRYAVKNVPKSTYPLLFRTPDYIYRTHQESQLQFLGTWIRSMCTRDPKIVWICGSVLHGPFAPANAWTAIQPTSSWTAKWSRRSSTCQLNLKEGIFSYAIDKTTIIITIISSVFVYLCYNSEGKQQNASKLWGRSHQQFIFVLSPLGFFRFFSKYFHCNK